MAKVLLIVEGERLEPRFFSRLAEVYGMNVEIVPFRANIYQLYRLLKEYDFDYDIKKALLEQNQTESAREILSHSFAYTYLIFDCDAQDHGMESSTASCRSLREVVAENISILGEMVSYFQDETDPDVGKLYVNYPMMEAYRDADAFFDNAFKDRMVSVDDLGNYKQIVAARSLARCHLDKLTRSDFGSLLAMQLFKLEYISFGKWKRPTMDEFDAGSAQSAILSKQQSWVGNGLMQVINTSLFLIVDYYGEKMLTERG